MLIGENSVVAIDYTLKNEAGEVIDTSEGQQPLTYLHGHGNIVEGLEEALTGKGAGETISVSVSSEKGYGPRDPERVFDVPNDRLPSDLEPEVGLVVGMRTPDGQTLPLTISAVKNDCVTDDGNHALAGQTLHFEVEVRDVRAATADELAHGHVHGPGGEHD
jgi:FKBP-type peptidyl-prolyl cis-trans isomerase SlyD